MLVVTLLAVPGISPGEEKNQRDARKVTETVCHLPLGGRDLLAKKNAKGFVRGFSFLR
jgi:hypothetical protein